MILSAKLSKEIDIRNDLSDIIDKYDNDINQSWHVFLRYHEQSLHQNLKEEWIDLMYSFGDLLIRSQKGTNIVCSFVLNSSEWFGDWKLISM
ncbi:MAG: hypothetical protein WCL06_00150 [Bacteroidota bacterium]